MLCKTLEVGLDTAIEQVASTYCICKSRAEGDVRAFIRDLESKGVLSGRQTEPPSESKVSARGNALRLMIGCISALPLTLKARSWALLGLSNAAIRFLGWPATLRAFQACHQKRSQVDSGTNNEHAAQDVDSTIRSIAASYPISVECKERALCCWSLLRRMGLPAKLVVAVSLYPLESHCWCELEGRVLTDNLDKCERFTPVVKYE